MKPRVAAAEHISQVIDQFKCSKALWISFFMLLILFVCVLLLYFQFNEEARSPFVKKYKTIIHPGEVWLWNFSNNCSTKHMKTLAIMKFIFI